MLSAKVALRPLPHLYLVDDEPEILKIMADWLAEDYTVTTFDSGIEFLRALDHTYPDLIVLDLLLPWIRGTELCAMLKNNPRVKGIPIVLITAFHNAAVEAKVRTLGAEAYLCKPFTPDQLKETINRLLGARPAAGSPMPPGRDSLLRGNPKHYPSLAGLPAKSR